MLEAKISGPNPGADCEADEVIEAAPLEGWTDEEFARLAASVMVVIPFRPSEGLTASLTENFGMWGRIGMRTGTVKDPFGGFIELTRGSMVDMFLTYRRNSPEVKYMVMIDSDQDVPWDAPLRLAAHGLPAVSGVVCNYSDARGLYACFTAEDRNGVARFPTLNESKVMPAEGLRKIHQAGTGLLCVRCDVLESLVEKHTNPFEIPAQYKDEAMKLGMLKKGEDMVFCDRIREAGFDIHVDFSVAAKHWKTLRIDWPEGARDRNLNPDDWSPSAYDYKV